MTRFAFTPEQQELRSVLRALLEREPTQHAAADGADRLWQRMSEQIGVPGLALPEEFGGAGYGDIELGIAMEETGRALARVPLLSTVVLAAKTVLHGGDRDAQQRILPRIATGELVASVAVTDDLTSHGARPTVARPDGDGWVIDGQKIFVLDGCAAQLLVVAATVDGAVALFTVDGSAPGLVREQMTTLDLTRPQARLRFDGVPAALLVDPGRAQAVLDRVWDEARVALALEQVGGAQKCLDTSVGYAKAREQFGRPIGSFQAVKHRCADMLVEVELARSTAYNACWSLTDGAEDDVTLAASMAKALCSDAFVFVATENIQVHGGIGFSWEHPAHLYFRRARSTAVMFGDANHHREVIAQRLGV